MKKNKRTLAMLLVIAMVLSILPFSVFAQPTTANVTVAVAGIGATNVFRVTVNSTDCAEVTQFNIGGADVAVGDMAQFPTTADNVTVQFKNAAGSVVGTANLDNTEGTFDVAVVATDPTDPTDPDPDPVTPGTTPVLGVTRVAASPTDLQVGEISEFTLTFYGSDGRAFVPDGSFDFYIRSSRAAEKIEALAAADQKGSFTAVSDIAAGKGTKVTVTSLRNGQLSFAVKSAFSGSSTISFWDGEAGDDSNKFGEKVLTFTPSKVDKDNSGIAVSSTLLQIFQELTLTATVHNAANVPVEGETVTFQKSHEGGVWTTVATKNTNAVGVASIKTTESTAGDYKYRARVGTETIGTSGDVKWTGTAPTKIEGKTADGSIAVDVEQNIEFVVKDAFDNAVAGQAVKLELDSRPSGAASFASKVENTNSRGEVAFKFEPNKVGTYKVKATVEGTGLTATVTLEAAPFGAVDRVRVRMAADRVSIKTRDGDTAAGPGNSMTLRVDLWDANNVRSTVSADNIRLDTSSIALASIDGLTVNANSKERRGVVTITATHLPSGKSGSIEIPVVGGTASIDSDVSVSNFTADVDLQFLDADENKTWASDVADTAFNVIAPSDLIISQRKFFKKMEGTASFRAVAEAAGTYTVRVVADNGLATTFDLVYGEPVPERPDAPAYGAASVTMFIGSAGFVVDGSGQTADVAPFIENDRTFVPVRFIAEALGAEADWEPKDAATEVVTLTRPDKTVTINIGEYTLTVEENGSIETITMDVAAMIREDRTFLPFRFIAEAFGAEADWGPKDAATEWVSFKQ